MKPLIYAIDKNVYGKVFMSEEEFKKILNEVYDAGYEDGKAQATRIYPSTPPIEPTPIPHPYKPYWDMVTNVSPRTSTTTTTGSSLPQSANSTTIEDNK